MNTALFLAVTLVQEVVYTFGVDCPLEKRYPAGPQPFPPAEEYVLTADFNEGLRGKVELTLENRDDKKDVRTLTAPAYAPEIRFDARSLGKGAWWSPVRVKILRERGSSLATPRWKTISAVRSQTDAEVLRFRMETGNPLRILRPGVAGEVPAAVFANPSPSALSWKGRLVFTHFHGKGFSEPFELTLAPGEERRLSYDPRRFAMGHWTVVAEAEAAGGSKAGTKSAFAKIPYHAASPKMPSGKFRIGLNYHMFSYEGRDRELTLQAITSVGAKIIRMTGPMFYWIQPKGPDSWDWIRADRNIESLVSLGLAIDSIIYQTPAWALAHPELASEPWVVWSRSRPQPGTFGRFCEALAKRYGTKIDYYEIGNEWDLLPAKTIKPEEAIEIQKEAYQAIKRVCPSATVIPNGWTSGTDKPAMYKQKGFHETVMRAAKDFCDAHPVHLHGWYDRFVSSGMKDFFALRERVGATRLPWYANECSMTGVHGSEHRVAKLVFTKILWSWAHGSRDYIWYNLRATGWAPKDSEQNFGILTADYYPRPSLAAFAALASVYQGLDLDKVLLDGSSRQVYRFRGTHRGAKVLVISGWDTETEKENVKVRIATDAANAFVMDIMGNAKRLPVEDGSVVFEFGTEAATLILKGATRAEPDPSDLARPLARAEVAQSVPPGGPDGRPADLVLADKTAVIDLFEANPETVHRTWRGPEDLSAKAWLVREGDKVVVTLAVTDDAHVPCDGKGTGDRLTVWMKAGEDEFNEEAPLVSVDGTAAVYRVTLGPVKGDAVRFNFLAQDDDGEGRDVRLTLPKARLFRFP